MNTHTDEELIADLGHRGLEGPFPTDLLASLRQKPELIELAARIGMIPDDVMRFNRRDHDMKFLPSDDPKDKALIAAWIEWRETLPTLVASGGDATDDQRSQALVKAKQVEATIDQTPAFTPRGAQVKLLRALTVMVPEQWVRDAIITQDFFALYVRAAELGVAGQLVLDAVAALGHEWSAAAERRTTSGEV